MAKRERRGLPRPAATSPQTLARLTVKLSANRQVVIPQRLCHELGLRPGDLLDATLDDGCVVFTPQALVDRRVLEKVRAKARLSAALRKALPTGPSDDPQKGTR